MTSRKGRRRGGAGPHGLEGLRGVVSSEVLHALEVSSNALRRLGIPHAVAGGLAVGYHGHPRATKDVDFLVDDRAFVKHAMGIVTLQPGVPIEVDGIPVDMVAMGDEDADVFVEEIENREEDLPFVSLRGLLFMKLKAARRQDKADIAALLENVSDEEIEEIATWIAETDDKAADLLIELANESD